MTRWWRALLALTMCRLGAVVLGPVPSASAAPPASAGLGRVIADLGTVLSSSGPGWSFDGAYYAYLVPAGDSCELRVYDVRARGPVDLTPARVACYASRAVWAARADTLTWRVAGTDGSVKLYVWDADPGAVNVVAADARVDGQTSQRSPISADGRFVAFAGRSESHPAPAVDQPYGAWFVHDRSTGVSLPLSRSDLHVEFTEWAPRGHHFVAGTRAADPGETRGTCFGSGVSCDAFATYQYFEEHWSPDGTAVLGFDQVAYDFTTDTFTPFPRGLGFSANPEFVGNDRVTGSAERGGFLWDLRTGAVTRLPSGPAVSPDGNYLLVSGGRPDTYRYVNVETGAAAEATYRGSTVYYRPGGYWSRNGSAYLGVGPGGCSSLRQWSPATNTVSLFGPPGLRRCFAVPSPRTTGTYASAFPTFSSGSGRFALFTTTTGYSTQDVLVDLRRHVLLGPLEGQALAFAPSGSDLLAVARKSGGGDSEVLLVDPTPVPDMDDKPRWSSATPSTGSRVTAKVGERLRVQLGASDLQGTPVNLYFRWRDTAGTPIKSAPKGWS